jgi:fructose-bisphosphate aldolase class II
MPIASSQQYHAMLDAARLGGFAYPAINIATVTSIHGALRGLAEAKSDGILQVLPSSGAFASGTAVNDPAEGAMMLAEAAHRLAKHYNVLIALHSDHCPPSHIESFLMPLLKETAQRRMAGATNLFHSHMFDGSSLTFDDNLAQARALLSRCNDLDLILEIEIGVVGGEDELSGQNKASNPDLYTTPEQMLRVYDALKGQGRYLLATAFGNVHGGIRPGTLELRPDILRDGQALVKATHGDSARFDLVFHGGSGTSGEQIKACVRHGVVKMNMDTDTQYAFSRPIAEHMFKHVDGMFKMDGNIGDKRAYDPRVWLVKGEQGICDRVKQACSELGSTGQSLLTT